MEPVIRNFRNVYTPEGPSARMIWLADNPATCTMTYSEIYPDKTSAHHIHEWEHEVYIVKGSGTLICDGKEYPVKAGDALFIPPQRRPLHPEQRWRRRNPAHRDQPPWASPKRRRAQ